MYMTDSTNPPRDANALVPTDQPEPPPEGHTYDLADYDWVPVRRQRRPDGWTRDKQRQFIATLAQTGTVRKAAYECGMSPKAAYDLRQAPGGAGFAAAWDAALQQSMHRLLDEVTDRAINGTEDAIRDREGRVIGHRTRYNDRLAMFLLRAHMPERFRLAHRDDRHAGEALPAPAPPVADAMAMLEPPCPANPHALMPPDDLIPALELADICEGELPSWLRDRDLEEPVTTEFDKELDRKLEASLRKAAGMDGAGD